MPELRQDQAAKTEYAECVALGVVTLLDVMTIDVAKCLGEPRAEGSPAFPLARLLAEPKLAVVREDLRVQSFADKCLAEKWMI
jgi:hypothetical protein